MAENERTVSFDDELLIVVDEEDQVIDYRSKAECHAGEGILHRAFSIFIFNDRNELLLQKRSGQKQLWPGYWSNSCCSHPRAGESNEMATRRRLNEELGITTPLKFLYKFQYHARFGNKGSEREICSVYFGKSNGPILANPNEIDEWKFVNIPELEEDLAANPHNYTPWFKMEWERIRRDYL